MLRTEREEHGSGTQRLAQPKASTMPWLHFALIGDAPEESSFNRDLEARGETGQGLRGMEQAAGRRIFVVNPGGRDADRDFAEGPGNPGDPGHPPVNYHAWAACTQGAFLRDVSLLPPRASVVLLLRSNLEKSATAVERLVAAGHPVVAAFKESGIFQVESALARPGSWSVLEKILRTCHGALGATPWIVPLLREAGAKHCAFLPTPYPVDFPQWDFSSPEKHRKGIFLGTREFDVPSRRHLRALRAAARVAGLRGETVTMIDDGSCPRRLRAELRGLPVNWVKGPLPYAEYLALMARHRLVFQMDRSGVPGQVAGDAALCGLQCLGGDGAIESLVFPETSGEQVGDAALCEALEKSFLDDAARETEEQRAKARAREMISYSAVADRLRNFFPCSPDACF